MKFRTIVSAVALVVAAGAAASAETTETDAAAPATERVIFAIQCVTDGTDPRCLSTNYALSLEPGDNSVGNALTITPAGYVLEAAGEEPTPATFSADSTLQPEYVLVGGSTITGQITLKGSRDAVLAVDSTVEVVLSAVRADTKRFVTLGTAAINKQVVVPGDNVYAFEFEVPAELDGVAVRALTGDVSNTQISAAYGYLDGQGGSWFDLPHAVTTTTEPTA
ncbi:MAG: hypothetical protein ACLGIG_12690 [Actinomycetes bacterium]